MQENPPQPVPQSPPPEDQQPESPPGTPAPIAASSPQTATSPRAALQPSTPAGDSGTTVSSPRNGHSAALTPCGPPSSGGSVSVGPSSGDFLRTGHMEFPLRRGSSSESMTESTVYTVPIKYRSGVGSFEEHVAYGFSSLYLSSDLSDVTIACEGKLIKAHKLVLAISSPYFRQIFEELHDFPCQHPVVILHGIKLKDWNNIMKLIYCGIAHISSNEVEDFIATAECLKIEGLAAEEPSSSHEDVTPPYEYLHSRLSGSDLPTPEEESGHLGSIRGGSECPYRSNSSDDVRFRYERRTGSPDLRTEGSDRHTPFLFGYRSGASGPGRGRVISSAQSSPGISGREIQLKVETQEEEYGDKDSVHATPRPPSCPEGLRTFSTSPVESHVQAVRHPVISRRPLLSSESEEGGESVGFLASEYSTRLAISAKSSRFREHFASSCEDRGQCLGGQEETERQFPSVISGHRSPVTPTISPSATRHPLSVIARQAPASTIPLQQLLSPPGFFHRMPQPHMMVHPGARSPIGEGQVGVITSVPSPRISPHSEQQQQHQQQSTLAMLRAKIAAGQQVYARSYRHERQSAHHMQYNIGQFPSAALGSSGQHGSQDPLLGSSRSSVFAPLHSPHQQHTAARPKTKAIRSSQVPQSARYTAAEVDAMVDKVQNFPGNMVPCAVCSKFVKRERLRAHIHECHLLHGKRIVCPHCGIGLKSKGSYRVHIWRHKRGALPTSRQRTVDDQRQPQSQSGK